MSQDYEKCVKDREAKDTLRPRQFLDFIAFDLDGDGENKYIKAERIFFTVYCALITILALFLYVRANKKLTQIKKRDPDIPNPEQDTYCVTNVYIVQVCKIQLCISILLSVVNVIMFYLPEFKDPRSFQSLLLYGYRQVINLQYFGLMQIYFLMVAEYYVMRYLILYEKNKSVQQIAYLYNNSVEFQKKEEKIKCRLIFTYISIDIVFFISSICLQISDILDVNKYERYEDCIDMNKGHFSPLGIIFQTILMSLAFACFLAGFFIFTHLLYLMYKRHRLEFKRSQTSMITVFVMTILLIGLTFTIVFFHFKSQIQSNFTIEQSLWLTHTIEQPYQKLEIYFVWIFQVPGLLVCIAIIEFKSTKDCLQGIAKLDYLIKVSMFQIYRDDKLNKNKGRLLSSMNESSNLSHLLDTGGNKYGKVIDTDQSHIDSEAFVNFHNNFKQNNR